MSGSYVRRCSITHPRVGSPIPARCAMRSTNYPLSHEPTYNIKPAPRKASYCCLHHGKTAYHPEKAKAPLQTYPVPYSTRPTSSILASSHPPRIRSGRPRGTAKMSVGYPCLVGFRMNIAVVRDHRAHWTGSLVSPHIPGRCGCRYSSTLGVRQTAA